MGCDGKREKEIHTYEYIVIKMILRIIIWVVGMVLNFATFEIASAMKPIVPMERDPMELLCKI